MIAEEHLVFKILGQWGTITSKLYCSNPSAGLIGRSGSPTGSLVLKARESESLGFAALCSGSPESTEVRGDLWWSYLIFETGELEFAAYSGG